MTQTRKYWLHWHSQPVENIEEQQKTLKEILRQERNPMRKAMFSQRIFVLDRILRDRGKKEN